MVAFGVVALAVVVAALLIGLVVYVVWVVRGEREALPLHFDGGYPSLPPGDSEEESRHADPDGNDLTDRP